jgi:5-methylcytosine-specific restriction protein A
LSTLTGPVETRLADLAVVCANCHRMIHRSSRLITLERLRRALGARD